MSQSESERTSFSLVVKIFIVYLIGVLGATVVSEAVPAMEGIAHELHPGSPALVGLVMSLPGLCLAVGALFAGYLTDRFGDKLIMTIGCIIQIAGSAMVATSHSMQILLSGRLLTGVGYVLGNVAAMTVLMRITRGKQRTWALAFWSTFPPASWIIPLAFAGQIAAMGWRVTFIGHAVLVAILLIAELITVPSPLPYTLRSDGGSHTAGVAAVLKAPLIWLAGISFAADSFLHNGIMSTTPPFLHATYGISAVAVDHWNIASMVINCLGCLLLGQMLAREMSPKLILFSAIALTGIPALAVYLLPLGVTGSIGAIWVLMFGSGILTGMWAYAPCISPSPQCMGATSGMLQQITLFGVLFSGPSYFVALAHPGGNYLALVSLLAVVVCCARAPIVLRFRNPSVANKPQTAMVEAAAD